MVQKLITMNNNKPSPYGYDSTAPFSLYQGDDGKWGLVDADGVRLPAVFIRSDDGEVFSSVPWEAMSFSEKVGFELLAWFDPDEVWFNFTFNNPAYPDRWRHLLWARTKGQLEDFREHYSTLLPEEDRWLLEVIVSITEEEKAIEERCGGDCDKEDEEMYAFLHQLVVRHPSLTDFAVTGLLLAPVLDNPDVTENEKAILWTAKVSFDHNLQEYYLNVTDNE